MTKSHETAHQLYGRSALKGSSSAIYWYSLSFIVDLTTDRYLEEQDIRNCFIWGYLAYKRNPKYTITKDDCGRELTNSERKHLIAKSVQLDRVIPD